MAIWNSDEVETDLRQNVDVVSCAALQGMAKSWYVNVAVLELGAEIAPSILVDPDLQQIREARRSNATNDLLRSFAVIIKGDLATVSEADISLRSSDEDRYPIAHR